MSGTSQQVAPAPRPAAETREFFQSLLDFEDAGLLDFRFGFDGMPIWPFARWETFQQAMVAGAGLQGAAPAPARIGLRGKLEFAWQAWRHRPWRDLRPFDVLWFGSSAGVVLRKEGRWFGRVNDYLVDLRPDQTLLIEDSHMRAFKVPRHVRNLRFHDLLRIRAKIAPGRPAAGDLRQVRAFIAHLRERFPVRLDGAFYAGLEGRLLGFAGCLPRYHASYSSLFEKARPKLLVQEDGSYGTNSHILRWAKQAGIKTAEMQHGVIVPTHQAYNYGAAGFHPLYRPHLPDYLLTYGGFWSGNARTPSARIEIGNPHFSTQLEAMRRGPAASAGRSLLVVSQADVAESLVPMARELSRLDGGLRITYRLHPAEAASGDLYRALKDLGNVAISSSGDIYGLIRAADWVVGASSTTLYEAVGLEKPVFVLDCPSSRLFTPGNFGTWFSGAPELLGLLRSDAAPAKGISESVWASDWEGNFRRFLEREIGLPAASR